MNARSAIAATEIGQGEEKGVGKPPFIKNYQTPPENDLYENGALQKSNSLISSLPDEVKKNLRGYENMMLDEQIISILGQYQGYISVDRIILKLWEDYKVSPLRAKVLAHLRLLDTAGQVIKQEGTKGNYELAKRNPNNG